MVKGFEEFDKWVWPVTELHALTLQQVKQSVSGAKVSPKVAGLLERIAEYHNIPRKKAKFEVLWVSCMSLNLWDT